MFDSKGFRRAVRYNPLVEAGVRYAKSGSTISFPEIGVNITAGPGDVIIDCGANVGDLTSRFARTGATVHAFEPNPLCYSLISRRFAALSNVVCYHKGVMDRPCTLSLETPVEHDRFDGLDVTVASSFINKSHGSSVNSVDVECVDFADFIRQLGKPVKLLKMDIEGAEIAVLNHLFESGLMERIEYAVVETHERFSDELARSTETLRTRIVDAGLASRVRLDWV